KLPSQHGSATCWPSPRPRRSGRSTSVVASSASSSRLHRTNFQRLREYPGATCERGESMRKRAITGELALLDHVKAMEPAELVKLQKGLRARLDDWRGLLRRQPAQGRQILRKLLVGRLTFTPRLAERGREYEYSGEATLGRLLAGALTARTMVTPAGRE